MTSDLRNRVDFLVQTAQRFEWTQASLEALARQTGGTLERRKDQFRITLPDGQDWKAHLVNDRIVSLMTAWPMTGDDETDEGLWAEIHEALEAHPGTRYLTSTSPCGTRTATS